MTSVWAKYAQINRTLWSGLSWRLGDQIDAIDDVNKQAPFAGL